MTEACLIVCTGNICRSAYAQAAFHRHYQARSIDAMVASAGTHALVGHPADALTQAIALDQGMNIETHRARQLQLDIARQFDMILVMEGTQQRWIELNFPILRGRVRRLGHWLDTDIPDPYGHPLEYHRAVYAGIEEAIGSWILRLCI